MNTPTESTYRRLILGLASDEEASLAEDAILAGRADASFLQDIEDGLIDDYLLGKFTREERQGFTAHFLTTEERKQRVAFASALVKYAQREMATAQQLTFSSRMTTLLLWRRLAWATSGGLVLLAVFLVFSRIELRRQRAIVSESQNEVGRLHAALTLAGGPFAPVPLAANESSAGLKDQASPQMPKIAFLAPTRGVIPTLLVIPAAAEFVRMDANVSPSAAEKYREAVLTPNGKPIWVQEFPASGILKPQQSTTILPATVFNPGLYHFQISKLSADGSVVDTEDHVFRVVRK